MKQIPGAVDVGLHQVWTRRRCGSKSTVFGRSRSALQRDVANSCYSLAQLPAATSPNFWTDPQNGINYPVADPDTRSTGSIQVDALLRNRSAGNGRAPQLLATSLAGAR